MARLGLYVYGAGGHGLVVAEAAEGGGWLVTAFVDDSPEHAKADGGRIISRREMFEKPACGVIVAIGDNFARERVFRELGEAGRSLVNVVHHRAEVSPTATLGAGVFISAMAVVNAEAQIGDGAIINTAAVVEHHCKVGAFAHIAPHATLGGAAAVGQRSLIGIGAAVLPGVAVGDDCTVGAGAVVTKDVPAGSTVIGVPARILQRSRRPHEEHDRMTGDGTILA